MFKCWLVRKVSAVDSSVVNYAIHYVKENAVKKALSIRRILNKSWKVQIVELVPHVIEDFEVPKGVN